MAENGNPGPQRETRDYRVNTTPSPRGVLIPALSTTSKTMPPTTTTPDDGPYTAERGDCFSDRNSSGSRSDFHRASCAPETFKVLRRVNGTSDTAGQCDGVTGTNWPLSWYVGGSREALVLCTQYLYRDDVFNGQVGQCALGNPDASGWHIVDRGDKHNFQILRILTGTSDHNQCGDDPRLRYNIGHSESRPSLSVVVCMSFRYGDDGAYAKVNNCMRLAGSGSDASLNFTDCGSANFYVTGYTHGRFDRSFCGRDGYYGWNDTGAWGRYLDYTVCLRRR